MGGVFEVVDLGATIQGFSRGRIWAFIGPKGHEYGGPERFLAGRTTYKKSIYLIFLYEYS